jgi:hypothetical protein
MAKSGAKKKGKLPKEVLGVKIPKELRRAGERVLAQAQTPHGREMIATGLTMAATAAAAALAKGRERPAAPAPHAAPREGAPRPEAGTQRTPDPQAVADAIGQAADAVLGRLFGKRV